MGERNFERPVEYDLPSASTCTTGSGPCILDGDVSALATAKLYKIEMGKEWEIGFVSARSPIGFMPALEREPIVSSAGHRKAVNWAAGLKEVHFTDKVPDWLVGL